MGNEPSIPEPAQAFDLIPKCNEMVSHARVTKEGDYYNYRRARVKRDAVCQHPFLPFSQKLQDECLDLQFRALQAQVKAAENTQGMSVLVELFEH